jgi:hypothetical protein
MKTRNLIIIAGLGGIAAYVFFKRKGNGADLGADEVPVDTIDANEPKVTTTTSNTTTSKKSSGLTLGGLFGNKGAVNASFPPNRESGYSQQFKNRVYTKVTDFYGEDANVGLYEPAKRLGLYERIWRKLSQKGVENPNRAVLGEIGPQIREIGQEGFDFYP